MADVELQSALGGLTQAIQQLTQNMGKSNYAYAPFSATSPSGGVAGVGGQVGSALGGPMGGLLGGFAGMFLGQAAPQLAAQVGTGPYQNSYYREQNAAVSQQLLQERGAQLSHLSQATGLSSNLLQTGSMLLDTLSPGTFDKIASTLDPSYLSGQAQFTANQAGRLAALRFGGKVEDYAKAFAGAKFDGLLPADAANAYLMASQTGQGRTPAGIVKAAQALGGVMSTVASVFGVDGGEAANLMQQNGLMSADAAGSNITLLHKLGAVGNLSGINPLQILQTGAAMGGGAQGNNAAINAFTTGYGVTKAGGSFSDSQGAQAASARLSHNMGGTLIGQGSHYAMNSQDPAEKAAFKRDPLGYSRNLLRNNPQGLKGWGGEVAADSFDEEVDKAARNAETQSTNKMLARKRNIDVRKMSDLELAQGADGAGPSAKKAIGAGLSIRQVSNAFTAELERRGKGTHEVSVEQAKFALGKATAASGMASGSLVDEVKKFLSEGKFAEILTTIATHLGVLAQQGGGARTAGNEAPAGRTSR